MHHRKTFRVLTQTTNRFIMPYFTYPPSPENVDKNVLRPTSAYRSEALKVTGAILFFITVYLLLLALSIGLAALVIFLGIKLIILKPMFATLMVGFGLAGLGLMVIYFLIKFIFSTKKVDKSGLHEIHEDGFPELYSFIRQLASETKTPMPKRIYLSPEVNASVFYDSSLLSMIFPVRKNLLIGLGFVNSVNLSEFRAVIAHEFGHFSQHSMQLGSYVFNVNKVIYNLLFDNKGYAETIDSWAGTSNYFVPFARLTVGIVQGIQWILQKVYILVNKTHLSLSRQMEHHADAVSAFVCGPGHLITALKRLEISAMGYNILINNYNNWIAENYKPDNIFTQHREILAQIGFENGLEMENGLPVPDSGKYVGVAQSRIFVKDQWSSHPGTAERERFIQSLGIKSTVTVSESPWVLFNPAGEIQEIISQQLFSDVTYKETVRLLDFVTFKEKYYLDYYSKNYQKEYRGFYNNRRIKSIADEELIRTDDGDSPGFDELFSVENCSHVKSLGALNADLDWLKSMQTEQHPVKSFEFDGEKCTPEDVPELIARLQQEKALAEEKIHVIDIKIVSTTLRKIEIPLRETLSKMYAECFNVASETAAAIERYNTLFELISPVYTKEYTKQEVVDTIDRIKSVESQVAIQVRPLLFDAKAQQYLNDEQLELLKSYLAKDLAYMTGDRFNRLELGDLNEAMNLFIALMVEREFRTQKDLLQKQLEVLLGN